MAAHADVGRKSKVGVYWSLGLKILHQAYHLVVLIALARLLSPADFGLMALAMTIILFANNLTACGLTATVVQKKELSAEEVGAVITCNLLLSVVMTAVFLATARFIAAFFSAPALEPVMYALTVLFPLTSFYHVGMALLRRDLRFKAHSLVDLLWGFSYSTIALVLAYRGFGVWSLAAAHIGATVLALAVLFLCTGWVPKLNARLGKLKPLAHYASMDLARSQIRYLEDSCLGWIIGYFLGPAALGFFERSQSFAFMPLTRIQMQVDAVLFSAFSRIEEDAAKLRRFFQRSLSAVSLAAVPLLAGLAAVAPHLVIVALGEKWAPMVTPLRFLSIAGILRVLASAARSMNVATDHYGRQTRASTISVAFWVALGIAGLPWGIDGVSVGAAVASGFTFLWYASVSVAAFGGGWRLFGDVLIPVGLAGAAMATSVEMLGATVLAEKTPLNLALLIAVGAATYLGLVFFTSNEFVREVREGFIGDLRAALASGQALLKRGGAQ